MSTALALPERLAEHIEAILVDLRHRTGAECILLADVSGQLITTQGRLQKVDPVLVATLAASDVAAMAAPTRQIGADEYIGEEDLHGPFLHEGENRSIYLFNIAGSFVLIVIFRAGTPIGLVQLFARRAAERLYPLTSEFEEFARSPRPGSSNDFGVALVKELDRVFRGL